MSDHYRQLAFTGSVRDAQTRYGSRGVWERVAHHDAEQGGVERMAADAAHLPMDPLGIAEQEFIAARDGFYLATVSETGWPYVQFRGGPVGFVDAPDNQTIRWPDFRGNRQYLSVGNLDHDRRVALFFMDYPHQQRLKVWGTATIVDTDTVASSPPPSGGSRAVGEAPSSATPPPTPWRTLHGYRARVEREIRVRVHAHDWNCPQHIPQRYSLREVAAVLERSERHIEQLRAENERLRGALTHGVHDV